LKPSDKFRYEAGETNGHDPQAGTPNVSEPICSLVTLLGKTSLFQMGEVSNLSEETDIGRIGFPRGNRGGMLGESSKGTWESL